ncbi:hypothetical protein GALMADRAFT_1326630 [Galerina marginata CBS 339.88]|uniref:Uncharacterized protein n=1 Tax=Galerina marginata (strain CBS 339.88) TaxID=685588 RepID=A0A067T5V5_GALM3|nr:hypothetical protein GALMADRAFT_1326630 [Galerina marginata CBS 339.88]
MTDRIGLGPPSLDPEAATARKVGLKIVRTPSAAYSSCFLSTSPPRSHITPIHPVRNLRSEISPNESRILQALLLLLLLLALRPDKQHVVFLPSPEQLDLAVWRPMSITKVVVLTSTDLEHHRGQAGPSFDARSIFAALKFGDGRRSRFENPPPEFETEAAAAAGVEGYAYTVFVIRNPTFIRPYPTGKCASRPPPPRDVRSRDTGCRYLRLVPDELDAL